MQGEYGHSSTANVLKKLLPRSEMEKKELSPPRRIFNNKDLEGQLKKEKLETQIVHLVS